MRAVVLVTKADCDLCDQAKRVLALAALEHDLSVREVSLDSEEGRRLGLEARAPFPPVVFLDGKPFSYGRLSQRRLWKALA